MKVIHVGEIVHKKLRVFCAVDGLSLQSVAETAIKKYIDDYKVDEKEEGESLI